jgi:hypothetical protein
MVDDVGRFADQPTPITFYGLDDRFYGFFAKFLSRFFGALRQKFGRPTAVGVSAFTGINGAGKFV